MRKRFCGVNFIGKRDSGAFTVSKKDVSTILNYIKNQEEYHEKKTFKEEYLEFLLENEIEFKEEYLFNFNLK